MTREEEELALAALREVARRILAEWPMSTGPRDYIFLGSNRGGMLGTMGSGRGGSRV